MTKIFVLSKEDSVSLESILKEKNMNYEMYNTELEALLANEAEFILKNKLGERPDYITKFKTPLANYFIQTVVDYENYVDYEVIENMFYEFMDIGDKTEEDNLTIKIK